MFISSLLNPQRTALVVGGLLLLGFLFGASIGVYAQISPGELSKAHEDLNGSGRCTECHLPGKRPPEFNCLSCHRDIRERITMNAGLHPSLIGTDRSGRSCAKCHSEHNGRNFIMIRWNPPIGQFDHQKTGYALEGSHAKAECRSCHQASKIPAASRQLIMTKDLSKTYLGLSSKCSSCHADAHQGQLSLDCRTCHDSRDWKKPVRFDHNNSRYKLDALHGKVQCDKCHKTLQAGQPAVRYRNIPFDDCSPCHRNPHSGAFKSACRSCHAPGVEWKSASKSAGFNHSKTRYPLSGKHSSVACASCHKGGIFTTTLPFAQCSDCHHPDPHKGQFAARFGNSGCADCHTVEGYKPASFDLARHAKTTFPLRESHVGLACAKCHKPDAAGFVLYRSSNAPCSSCHQDSHESQFAGAPHNNKCESCHNERVFKPSLYTAAQHSDSRFPLVGGHVKRQCNECHKPDSRKTIAYRFADLSCVACHPDPHNNQFAARMKASPGAGIAAGCQACHSEIAWGELSRFDHATAAFRLEGAHATVDCIKCHAPSATSSGLRVISYFISTSCESCHRDPHEGQFASRVKAMTAERSSGGCELCHGVKAWNQLTGFDHSTTSFPLVGAHKDAACEKCHQKEKRSDGSMQVKYVNSPRQCAGCHEDVHGGQFALAGKLMDCAKCHAAVKWAPSEFNHDAQSTYKLTGVHRNVRCVLCHFQRKEPTGKNAIIYRGTPRECSACHSGSEQEL